MTYYKKNLFRKYEVYYWLKILCVHIFNNSYLQNIQTKMNKSDIINAKSKKCAWLAKSYWIYVII